MKSEILIYDHNHLYSDCMCHFLQSSDYGKTNQLKIVKKFEELLHTISDKVSLLILSSVGHNQVEALDTVEAAINKAINLKIILISPDLEVKVIKKFFDKGVKSILNKNSSCSELLTAITYVFDKKLYITDDIKNALFNFICSSDEQNGKKSKGCEELSDREKDVLSLICEGFRTKEIADKLFISTHTVESHRRNIMLKLNVRNSSMLVKFAIDNNLVN